jgi:RpiR family carbohydrate utilization transcriptional regulator
MDHKFDEGVNVSRTPVWEIKLRSVLSSLGAAERRVADYILNNPDKIVYQSITELSEAADASEATVVRFCRRLGHKGFQGLKIAMAQDIVPELQAIYEEIRVDDDITSIKNKVFYGSIKAIQDTMTIADDAQLSKAIDAIAGASKFDIYGLGGSGCIAEDARHKFMKIGVRSAVYTDCNLQAMSAALLGPGDVALAISHSGSVKDVVEALQIAKQHGATTICITHLAKSPITKVAEIKLFTTACEMIFRSDAMVSRIAQLAIIDTVYVGVALKLGDQATQSLKMVRQAVVSKGF